MVRVEVKNFQAMIHQVVEIDGFVAVAGDSNVGKSAIVRAIKAALTGAPADHYVRHSADCARKVKGSKTCKCFCSVRITDANMDLLWEKGDKVNRYVFNGVEHTVPGRGTPEFLGPTFAPIDMGSGSRAALLQVSDQFDPLFILNKSGTVVADVLSDVAKLDQINEVARLVEKDRREAASTRKVRDKDILDLQASLNDYAQLDSELDKIEDLKDLGVKLYELEAGVERVSRYQQQLTASVDAVKSLQGVGAIAIPELSTSNLSRAAKHISRLCSNKSRAESIISQLSGIDEIALPEQRDYRKLAADKARITAWVQKVAVIKSIILASSKVSEVLVPDMPNLESYKSVARLSRWRDALSSAARAGKELQVALAAAIETEREVLKEFQSLGVCPSCKQSYHPQVEHREAANA